MADMQTTTALASAKTVGRPGNFYPSPFFDLAQTYLPTNIKDVFDWCAYYFKTNPIINGVVTKLAAYPITDLMYGDPAESSTFKHLFEGSCALRTFLVSFGLDRNCFGIALASVIFPFVKMLTCRKCKDRIAANKADYTNRSGKFVLRCKCGEDAEAAAHDVYIPAQNQIKLKRWSPKQITIRVNECTGETRYFYSLSRATRNEIVLGNKRTLEATPQAFIDAVHSNKLIELPADTLFVSRRPTISGEIADDGWGAPIIMPVLKDVFLLQVLKKSQEVVAMEYILPFRSLYPEIRADGGNVYGQINLSSWQNSVKKEIQQWKKDPAHIAVMPVPIGQQVMGGQGRSLMLHQEVRVYSDQIIAGMGVPTGFFYGEAMYSGASVNLRALENEFLAYRQDMQHLVEFIVARIARGLSIEPIVVKFREFKMADDMAKAGMHFNMANAKKLSWRTFLNEQGFDYDDENKKMMSELKDESSRNLETAKSQAAVQSMMMQEQARTQQLMQPPPAPMPPPGSPEMPVAGAPAGPGDAQPPAPAQGPPDLATQATELRKQLEQMPEVARYQQLARLRQDNYELYQAVNNMAQGAPEQAPGKPLPEQLPPRSQGVNRRI